MTTQLHLLDSLDDEPTSWRLSDETRRIGLDGVARARAALHAPPAADTDRGSNGAPSPATMTRAHGADLAA